MSGQAELEVLRQQLMEQNRKLDQRRNEYDLLKSLIDSMEGYPDSVKFLHKNPNWNHHAPILSDIIYVKEPYRAAVENVLEPYLNYYVVSDLQEGLQAVNLLEANQKGKANFFLLDKINAFENPVINTKVDNTIPVLDVVEVEPRYKKLAEHLLGHVIIAENDSVLETTTTHTIIEKSGKYVKGKYTLTGGSVGLFEGKKIGRAKNLEKLKAEIEEQEAVVDHLKELISKKHEEVLGFNAQLKEQAIRQSEQEILQLTNAVFAAQNKRENLQHLQENASDRIEQYSDQLEAQQDAIANIRETLEDVAEQLNQQREQLTAEEDAYKASETEYQQFAGLYNEGNLAFTRQQSRIEGLTQELRFKQQQVETLQKQIIDSKNQLEAIAGQLDENQTKLTQSETELTELMRKKESDEKTLNEADRDYYAQRNSLHDRESALRLKTKAKETVDHVLEQIKDELNNLKLQLAGIKERLDVEFKIKIEDILDQDRENDTPTEELQAAADRMKKRLENLGEVNPTAIEAFQEMKVRYEFILEQKNDLVNAKESLMQTIQEVEATANKQFLDTFNAVRENFQHVFKALFTDDDTADMVLENPDNLAETGIDIVAKPKGKRPSSISQLSGGEKTLTATALLFSIYLIKPAPFCILDEVDAPLDDANVGKFTQMIRKFSEKSQFIIVTHNKQTMGEVDVIYGVTMQEAGVSKLVPVDFRSLN
jgi:chromosome segregation protein